MARKQIASQDDKPTKNPAAVALGRKGGEKTALRGSAYFRKIAAKRMSFKGGRPPKQR